MQMINNAIELIRNQQFKEMYDERLSRVQKKVNDGLAVRKRKDFELAERRRKEKNAAKKRGRRERKRKAYAEKHAVSSTTVDVVSFEVATPSSIGDAANVASPPTADESTVSSSSLHTIQLSILSFL